MEETIIDGWKEDTLKSKAVSLEDIAVFMRDKISKKELDEAIPEWEDGDDWCIRITCVKRFLRKDGLSTHRYFDNNNIEIFGDECDRLAEVDSKKYPLCIESDGVSLVED